MYFQMFHMNARLEVGDTELLEYGGSSMLQKQNSSMIVF